jgi:phosphoglycerate dehydrogenase-like enzyme
MSGNIVLLAPDDDRLEELKRVAPEGIEVVWVDSNQPVERSSAHLERAVALIPQAPFTAELARACPNLKLVQATSAGTDRIDVAALGELGIRVANNGGGNSVSVAEHAIGLMISVYRKLQLQFQSVKSREWYGDIADSWISQAHELTDKTVGIIGLGHIGQQVARRLQGWECDLVYHDVVTHPPELEQELHVTRLPRDELLKTSDIVTLHVSLTKRTRAMIGDREFEMMKPNAVLINTCRGPVVDEAALVRALRSSKIAGAGLDVLEQEPPPSDNPLLDMENALVTPHMAGFAQEAGAKSDVFAMQNIARVLRGEEPQSVVLPE